MAAGAIIVGALVTLTGFSAAFLVVAAAMLPALVLARREAQPDPARSAEVDLVPAPATA
jgi:predicted MFS family arabinose efflux permease